MASGSINWNGGGLYTGISARQTVVIPAQQGSLKMGEPRGIIVRNTACRTPVLVTCSDTEWDCEVHPQKTIISQILSAGLVIDFVNPFPMVTDRTAFVITDFDVQPFTNDPDTWRFYKVADAFVTGQFSGQLALGASGSVTLFSRDALVTGLDIDVQAINSTATGSIAVILADGFGNVLWTYSLALLSGQAIPFAKLFTLRYPELMFASSGMVMTVTNSGATPGASAVVSVSGYGA